MKLNQISFTAWLTVLPQKGGINFAKCLVMTNQEYLTKLYSENLLLAQNLSTMSEIIGGIDDTRFIAAFRKYHMIQRLCEKVSADLISGKIKLNDEYFENPFGKTA